MAIAAPLALAATGLSAVGSFIGADRAAQGAEMEAQNAANAVEMGKIKAAQTSGDMTRRLTGALANIQAVRASAQLNPYSPTGNAIAANVQGQGDINRTAALTNINAQIKSDQNAENFYQQSAGDALLGGAFGALGSIFKGVSGINFSGGGS